MKRILVSLLVVLIALEILHQFTGSVWVGLAAFAVMGLAILVAFPRLGLREYYLLSLCGVMGIWLWVAHEDPGAATVKALTQAVFLMAFLLSISLIQEAAQTSTSVTRLGEFLSRQPGGRRYAGLYTGTMSMAVVFNVGTLSLLTPLITRGTQQSPDDPLGPIRERRQLNAVLRGFAWSVVWSPTAIAPLALFGLLPEANRITWISLGFGFAIAMLLMGWLEDRIAWRNHTAEAYGLPPIQTPPFPGQAFRRFLGVCIGLAVLTGIMMAVFGLGVPGALMGSAPLVMLGWLFAQGQGLRRQVHHIMYEGLPATTPAAVTLGCAGFVGIAGAALLPAQAVADLIDLDAVPAWIFLTGTTLAVMALSQFGLSPIMMAVFFGAVLGSLDRLPADQTLTALAVAAGLAATTTFSPFATGVVFLSRVTSHAGVTLTYRWNGLFTAISAMVLACSYWVLTNGG